MARSFPLNRGSFADRLLIRSVSWQLQENVEMSGYGSGEPLEVELGPPVWIAEIQMANLTQFEAVEQRALIQMHFKPGRPFRFYNRALPGPRYDPQGTILGAATPTVHTVGAEGRSLRVTGLPAGYQLSVGDMLQVTFGSSPIRYSLHQIGEAATASAGGLTPEFAGANLPVGVDVGAAVTLVRAGAIMVRVPGSYQPGASERNMVTGMGFRAIQVRAW